MTFKSSIAFLLVGDMTIFSFMPNANVNISVNIFTIKSKNPAYILQKIYTDLL